MCNGQHRDLGGISALLLTGQHDNGRAVFASLLLTSQMFVVPEIRIGNDKAGFWSWDRQYAPLLVEHRVKLRVPGVHTRGADGMGLLLR